MFYFLDQLTWYKSFAGLRYHHQCPTAFQLILQFFSRTCDDVVGDVPAPSIAAQPRDAGQQHADPVDPIGVGVLPHMPAAGIVETQISMM